MLLSDASLMQIADKKLTWGAHWHVTFKIRRPFVDDLLFFLILQSDFESMMDLTALCASATAKVSGRQSCLLVALTGARVASPLLAPGMLQNDLREGKWEPPPLQLDCKICFLSPTTQQRRDRFSRTNVEAQLTPTIIVHILKAQS
jgi:hypothetical protein